MGFMTRDEMVARVEKNTGNLSDDTFIGESIQIGLNDLCVRHDFPQALTLDLTSDNCVVDQASDNLPTDIWKLHDISMDDGAIGWIVTIKPKKVILDAEPAPELASNGKPIEAYIVGAKAYWNPKPDAAYNIRWLFNKLLGSAYTSNIASPIEGSDDSLVAFGTWRLLARYERFEAAEYWREEYERESATLIDSWSKFPGKIIDQRDVVSLSGIYDPQFFQTQGVGMEKILT